MVSKGQSVGLAFGSLLVLSLLAACQPPGRAADLAMQRAKMVERQLAAPGRDITNRQVLAAMRQVPRHEFVPADYRHLSYTDSPLPVGYGQTISQPYIVALMTQLLEPQPTHRVLEIGTGSGYQAAVLAGLVKDVYTIEIIPELARRAKADLLRLGYTNIQVRAGDGYAGWPEAAPFHSIIVTCAPNKVPQKLVDQLADNGKMVIPVGVSEDQTLYVLMKTGGRLNQKAIVPVRFVPMTGGK